MQKFGHNTTEASIDPRNPYDIHQIQILQTSIWSYTTEGRNDLELRSQHHQGRYRPPQCVLHAWCRLHDACHIHDTHTCMHIQNGGARCLRNSANLTLRSISTPTICMVYTNTNWMWHKKISVSYAQTHVSYGVALVSRIDKIIGLFCKRAL